MLLIMNYLNDCHYWTIIVVHFTIFALHSLNGHYCDYHLILNHSFHCSDCQLWYYRLGPLFFHSDHLVMGLAEDLVAVPDLLVRVEAPEDLAVDPGSEELLESIFYLQ